MDLPPPFEALPADRRALRLRALRDGLIVSGLLATAFLLLVVTNLVHSFGYDAYSYWSVDFNDLYGRAMSSNFALGAFRYTPPIAYLFAPLGALQWWLFVWLWTALSAAILTWLGGRWTIVLLALPPVALELYHGNIHLLIAVAIALGFRYPWTWAFVLLSKITPGIGLLWFAVRREWRNLAIALGSTVAVVAVSFVLAPNLWADFVAASRTQVGATINVPVQAVPIDLPARLVIGALLVIWGARTDRAWVLPIVVALTTPFLWWNVLAALVAAIPLAAWEPSARSDAATGAPG